MFHMPSTAAQDCVWLKFEYLVEYSIFEPKFNTRIDTCGYWLPVSTIWAHRVLGQGCPGLAEWYVVPRVPLHMPKAQSWKTFAIAIECSKLQMYLNVW